MPPRSIDAAAAAVLKCSLELHKWPLLFLPTRSEFQIGILRTYRDSARTAQHSLCIPLFIQTSPSTPTKLPVQASGAPNCIERFKDFGLKFAFASASLKNIIRAASLNEESSPKIKSEKLRVFLLLTSARKASFGPSVDRPNSIGSENESGAKSPSTSLLVSFRVSLQRCRLPIQ